MENILENWVLNALNWPRILGALAILAVTLLLAKYGVTWLMRRILRAESHLATHLSQDITQGLAQPLRLFVLIVGIWIITHYLNVPLVAEHLLYKAMWTVLLISIGRAAYRLVPVFFKLANRISDEVNEKELDTIITSFLTRVAQAVVVLVVAFFILSVWHINVNGLFTGVGLTGLAISMAAQDQLKNLLGGVVIIVEKPFSIGEKIETPSVAGVAEDITFRSTHLRTADGDLQVVPNSTLAQEPITNLTRIDVPRVTMTFDLDPRTSAEAIDRIHERVMDFLQHDERFMADEMDYKVLVVALALDTIQLKVKGPLSAQGRQDSDSAKSALNKAIIQAVNAEGVALATTGA